MYIRTTRHAMSVTWHLPNELLLLTFSSLPLPGLLSARAVCSKWRHLVPLAHIPLTRRKLLCLYDNLLALPAFHLSRSMARNHIKLVSEEERERFVQALPEDTCEEFKAWVEEWPETSVIGALWPWLQQTYNMSDDVFIGRKDIKNRLVPPPDSAESVAKPSTHAHTLALFSSSHSGASHVTALPLFDEGNGWTHWVVLSGSQEMLDTRGHKKVVDLRGVVFSKIRGADGEDGYAEFLEGPSPMDLPRTATRSCQLCLHGGGPETWGPWFRYLEQEAKKLQTSMEDAGAWCPCAGCRARV